MSNISPSLMGFNFQNSYLDLPEVFYTIQKAVPVKDPSIILFNVDLAREIGLDPESLSTPVGAAILSGNKGVEGAQSYAQGYSGHQFGYFTQLGDGRALTIGEHLSPSGERFDIQLKGSGKTPYSRRGDGRAGLGPMLREYLISEAMGHLGIPTTRSLAVVSTGEKVYREYALEGAILTRVAASHIRVGTFQFAASQPYHVIESLLRYTLERHYPGCIGEADEPMCLLRAFAERQARLIAQWQAVGFVHGVMNTDNVSLAGETIDYGPCAFMDRYHPDVVFSSIDTAGRYRFGNQPLIGKWNLARFAETLLTFMGDDGVQKANQVLEHYDRIYEAEWLGIMRRKLGLLDEHEGDSVLVGTLLACMADDALDYSDTFVKLTQGLFDGGRSDMSEAFRSWHEAWALRFSEQKAGLDERRTCMMRHNPVIIPRNHNVEHALNEWVFRGNNQPYMTLLEWLKQPYLYTDEQISAGAPKDVWPKEYKTTCGT
ncbi:MAG TPA: YdiU family protein [Clostridiales bacterium UBA8960]|nr:YdiU family protein [Clostridiales bacterium UBA8960]